MKKYTFQRLYENNFLTIPCCPGVYFVTCGKNFKHKFIHPGTGGHFKCKDPNVSVRKLKSKWVLGNRLLYIGQTRRSLRERIALFAAFGSGYPVAHRGGRYIWQIKNATSNLYVHCEEIGNPRAREKEEIAKFEKKYKKLPFANLIR